MKSTPGCVTGGGKDPHKSQKNYPKQPEKRLTPQKNLNAHYSTRPRDELSSILFVKFEPIVVSTDMNRGDGGEP